MQSFRFPLVLPALLLGAALMITFQVGAGLLLYGGPGLIPSLSVIMATGTLALAVGLNPASTPGDGSALASLEVIRRRWLLLLVALVVAALYSLGWSLGSGFGARPQTQAVGLTLLVALPMLFGGSILRSLIQTDAASGPDAVLRVATSTLLGVAVGALLLGHVFFRLGILPTSTLLSAVVLVSVGALAHGQTLDPPARPASEQAQPELWDDEA